MCRRWSPTAVSADAKQRGARQHIMGRRRHDDPPPQGLRAARCRTARCRVKLYGASTTRRPTATRTACCAVADCAVPGDTVWGVVGTTTHRRKEVCGGQATVVGHSVC